MSTINNIFVVAGESSGDQHAANYVKEHKKVNPEAVFTAICRKNYGCNHFIIGRDHTGLGNFYKPNASQRIFEEIDIGMEIISFGTASYCTKRQKITTNFNNQEPRKKH